MNVLLVISTLLSATTVNGVSWNGNWAFACDFNNHDLSNAKTSGEKCGEKCAATSGCTHFAWTNSNGGTCWMKYGPVCKSDAKDNGNNDMVCGIITETCGNSDPTVHGVSWNGNWAFACDFKNHDLSNAPTSGEGCSKKCVETSGCTHFAWTNNNGGTCWMKYGPVCKSDAKDNGNKDMVCGIVTETCGGGGGVGRVYQNVLATRHVNGGGDACALPKTSYSNNHPFALGNIAELGELGFKPDLCGHILTINCGHGTLDIIITNSNYGGGIDLYSRATWPTATGNQPPGQARCSVQLTNKNPISGGNNRCFYKPGTGTNNPYYRNVGLLNTNEKIVTDATVSGRSGAHRGDNPYYAFDLGRPIDQSEQVTFKFNDGSSHTVRFSDCIDVGSEQYWT